MTHSHPVCHFLSLLLALILIAGIAVSCAEEEAPTDEDFDFSDIEEEIALEESAEEIPEEEIVPETRLAAVKLKSSKAIALRDKRTLHNTDFRKTGTAMNGEIVTVIFSEKEWSYIQSADGEGFILNKFLTDPSEAAPTATPQPTATPAPTPIVYPDPTSYTDTRAAFPTEPGEAQKVLLSFIGDVTLGCNEGDYKNPRSIISHVSQFGYGYPFARVSYILKQDDLTIANMEGTFHSDSSGLTPLTKKAYNFRAPVDYVEILREASIEAVAMGNNHSGDFGEPGFQETVEVLENNGIGWFGNTPFSVKGYIYEHNGAKIGFVSCYISYWVINDGEHVPLINSVIDDLRAQGADVLIVYMHGGVEYAAVHDRNQERFVKYFIKKGADIVIGGHPHCLQGYSLDQGVPVYYSLGNFVFGGNFKFYTTKYNKFIKYTAILQCALSFDEQNNYLGCRFNIIPCRLGEDKLMNQYQPFPVTGEEAEECLSLIALDTNKFCRLAPLIPDVGAMQDFIPAKTK